MVRFANHAPPWTCKPLKRLDLNFSVITSVRKCFPLPTAYPARLQKLLFLQPSPSVAHVCASRPTNANKGASNQLDCCSAPRIRERATSWIAALRREQVSPDTGPGLEKIGECGKIEKNKSGFEC